MKLTKITLTFTERGKKHRKVVVRSTGIEFSTVTPRPHEVNAALQAYAHICSGAYNEQPQPQTQSQPKNGKKT